MGGGPPVAFADFTEVLRRGFPRRDPIESPALTVELQARYFKLFLAACRSIHKALGVCDTVRWL